MNHLTDDQLSAMRDGALTGPALERARRHLAGCAECREALATLERVDEALGRALAHDPGEAYFDTFASRVSGRIAALDRAAAPRARSSRGFRAWLLAPAGLRVAGSVAAVLVLAGLVYFQRDRASVLDRPELKGRAEQVSPRTPGGANESSPLMSEQRDAPSGETAPASPEGGEEARSLEAAPAPREAVPAPDAVLRQEKTLARERDEQAAPRVDRIDAASPLATGATAAPEAAVSKLDARERGERSAATRVDRSKNGREEVPLAKRQPPRAERESAPATPPGAGPAAAIKPPAPMMGDRLGEDSGQARRVTDDARAGFAPGVKQETLGLEATAEAAKSSAAPGETRVCGRVTDALGRPVAGAEVAVTDVGRSVTAGPDGRFCVSAPPGEHTISVLRVGYEPLRQTLTVGPESGDMTLALRSVTVLPSPASGTPGTGSQAFRGNTRLPTPGVAPGTGALGRWPLPVLTDVARAESAAELAERTRSAPRYEDAARAWERVLTRLGSPDAQLEARERIAESRWRAWELDATPARAASARVAITAFLALRPAETKAKHAEDRLTRLPR